MSQWITETEQKLAYCHSTDWSRVENVKAAHLVSNPLSQKKYPTWSVSARTFGEADCCISRPQEQQGDLALSLIVRSHDEREVVQPLSQADDDKNGSSQEW